MTPVSGKPRVVVVGSGYRLAMTAYALAKKLGRDDIAVAAVDVGHDDPSATITTLSDMRLFNARLGIDEKAFLSTGHADINLGWMLRRTGASSEMMFANGRYGVPMNNTQFHQLYHIYQKHSPGVALDEFSLASRLAKAGKFSASHKDPIFSTLDYGYTFRSTACEKYFKRLALHLDVTYIRSDDLAVAKSQKGVDKIVTKTGQILEADLFIDCSKDGSLISKVGPAGKYAPIDRRTILPFRHRTSSPVKDNGDCGSLYSEWQETEDGLQTTITHGGFSSTDQVDFLPSKFSATGNGSGCKNNSGFTYASALASSWSGNCVALGSAYANLPNIFLGTHQLFLKQLLQLLDIWFGQKDCPAIAAAFSQSSVQTLSSIVDVINLQLHAHPALTAAVDLTEMNRSRIELFCGSGALPLTENAIIADQQWIALLIALGFHQQGSTLQASAQTITNTFDQLDPLRNHIRKITESVSGYGEWINEVRART